MQTSRKIKVFLSGVVNSTNAQNLNCRALLEHLNSEKFEVRALTVYSGNLPRPQPQPSPVLRSLGEGGTSTYEIHYPARIWHAIQLVRGILWCDVAYLCKPEHWKLQRFLCRLFRKRAFKTVEGALIGSNIDNALRAFGSQDEINDFDSFTGNTYSISRWMMSVNERFCGIKSNPKPLYIGVDSRQFVNDVVRERLTDVVMIGSNLFYKGIEDYFALAKRFPQLTFHIVGSGLGMIDPAAEIVRRGLSNMIAHGSLSHEELAQLLKDMQLHIFPSKAEGFGKVTFETAAAGVPSLVYGCYGAREWIDSGVNGLVVDTFDEMAEAVQKLVDEPAVLRVLSVNARQLATEWDWKNKIGPWEQAILDVSQAPRPRRCDAWQDVRAFCWMLKWKIVGNLRKCVRFRCDYYRGIGGDPCLDSQFVRLSSWEDFRTFMIDKREKLYDWQIRRFETGCASFVCLTDGDRLLTGGWEVQEGEMRKLYDFVTPPAHRKKGYYTRLLKHLRSEGACYIFVRPGNVASVTAIRHAGFEKYDSKWERNG